MVNYLIVAPCHKRCLKFKLAVSSYCTPHFRMTEINFANITPECFLNQINLLNNVMVCEQ